LSERPEATSGNPPDEPAADDAAPFGISGPADDENDAVAAEYNFATFYADQDVRVPTVDVSMLPDLVADLSATSEVHDRRFDTVGEKITDLDGRSHDQGVAVQNLVDGFAALEASLLDKANLAIPSRWAWPFLTKDEANQLWIELRWFVDQFTTRYPLAVEVALPPCWYRHELARDELTAVYAAWREAFCGSNRPTSAMAAWWDRWLWPALHRLSSYADWLECKQARRHVEPTARQETTDDGFEDFLSADVAGRPAQRASALPWQAKKSGIAATPET
jgi:hypothetical protein